MMTLDYTAIVLAVLTMVSGWVTYWFDHRRHNQEIEGLKADNRQKDLDLSKREVSELRSEVAQLRHAIELVSDCPHRDACPVRAELQHYSQSE